MRSAAPAFAHSWLLGSLGMTVALVISVLLSCSEPGERVSPPAIVVQAAITDDIERKWGEMLRCGLDRTTECLNSLRALATGSSPECLAELARVLIDEWEIREDDSRLETPRLVSIQQPEVDDIRDMLPTPFESTYIVVSGVVDTRGAIRDATIVRAGKYPAVAAKICDIFSRAKYRPARKGKKYVEQNVQLLYRIEASL